MKKKMLFIISIVFIFIIVFVSLKKWDTNIFMEMIAVSYVEKVDIQISIDNELIYDDTLRKHPLSIPQHIVQPISCGYHKIRVSSRNLNINNEEEVFIFFNRFLAINFYKTDSCLQNKPYFRIWTGTNPFVIE